MKELVVATRNRDKKREIRKLLRGLRIKVTCLDKYPGCPQVKEGNSSFQENAMRKAMTASRLLSGCRSGES